MTHLIRWLYALIITLVLPMARSGTTLSPFLGSGVFLLILMCALLTRPIPAQALEKYGRPLPPMGDVGEEPGAVSEGELVEEEQHVLKGYLLSAAFVDNPTFAARPDNTGLVGLRHMVHLETTSTRTTSSSIRTRISSLIVLWVGSSSPNGI